MRPLLAFYQRQELVDLRIVIDRKAGVFTHNRKRAVLENTPQTNGNRWRQQQQTKVQYRLMLLLITAPTQHHSASCTIYSFYLVCQLDFIGQGVSQRSQAMLYQFFKTTCL